MLDWAALRTWFRTPHTVTHLCAGSLRCSQGAIVAEPSPKRGSLRQLQVKEPAEKGFINEILYHTDQFAVSRCVGRTWPKRLVNLTRRSAQRHRRQIWQFHGRRENHCRLRCKLV